MQHQTQGWKGGAKGWKDPRSHFHGRGHRHCPRAGRRSRWPQPRWEAWLLGFRASGGTIQPPEILFRCMSRLLSAAAHLALSFFPVRPGGHRESVFLLRGGWRRTRQGLRKPYSALGGVKALSAGRCVHADGSSHREQSVPSSLCRNVCSRNFNISLII